MYEQIINACKNEKVLLLPINIPEIFKKKQKLSDEAISKEKNRLFYEVILRVNDMTKKKSKRLTETEIRIASWIVDEIIENGQIEEDRERYEKFLNKLVSEDVMQERSWNQMRKNLKDKNFFKYDKDNKRYSIVVEDLLIKILSKKALNVLIYV
jgi:hypothetical protein